MGTSSLSATAPGRADRWSYADKKLPAGLLRDNILFSPWSQNVPSLARVS